MDFRRDLRVCDDLTPLVAVTGTERRTSTFTLHNASRWGFALAGDGIDSLDETFEFSIQTSTRPQPIYGVAAVRWRRHRIGAESEPLLGARILNFYDDGSHFYLDYLSELLSRSTAKDVMLSPIQTVDRNRSAAMPHADSQDPYVLRSGSTILGYVDPKSGSTQFHPFVIYFSPETPLLDIYDQLGFAGERYAAVLEQNKVVGMVSSSQIVPYMAELSALKHQNLKVENERLVGSIRMDLETRLAVLRKYGEVSGAGPTFLANFLANFCTRVEKDVLELFRHGPMSEEGMSLNRKLGDIEETLELVGSNFYPIAMERQIELQLDIDGAVPKIKVDHERFEQVLTAFLVEQLDGVQPWHRLILTTRCYPTKVMLRIEFLATDDPVEYELGSREALTDWADWQEAPLLGLTNQLLQAHRGVLEFQRLPEGAGYIYFMTLPIAEFQ